MRLHHALRAATAASKRLYALIFGATTSDRVTIPYSPSLDITGGLTIEFWLFYSTLPSNMVSKYPGTVVKSNMTFRHGIYHGFSNRMGLRLNYQLANQFETDYTINASTGQWVHFSATFNGRYMYFYENGIQVHSADAGKQIAMTTDTNDIAIAPGWIGQFSDVRIWNIARTQQEIQDNMDNRLTGNETGLVAYYKLDEGAGTTAIDSAGTNNGTITGATWTEINSFPPA